MTDRSPSTTPEPGSITSELAVITGLATAATCVSLWAPLVGDGSSLSDDSDAWLYIHCFGVLGIAAIGVLATHLAHTTRRGLVTGALATVAALFTSAGAFATFSIVELDADVAAGVVGCYAVIAAAAVALVRLSAGTPDRAGPRVEGPLPVVGMLAAVATVLGVMLPTGSESFSNRNFEWGDGILQAGWLGFLFWLGIAGLIGFARRTVGGSAMVVGCVAGNATLWLSVATDDVDDSTFHAVYPIAIGAQLVVLVIIVNALRQQMVANQVSERGGSAAGDPPPYPAPVGRSLPPPPVATAATPVPPPPTAR